MQLMRHGGCEDGLVSKVIEGDGEIIEFLGILHFQETKALFKLMLETV